MAATGVHGVREELKAEHESPNNKTAIRFALDCGRKSFQTPVKLRYWMPECFSPEPQGVPS